MKRFLVVFMVICMVLSGQVWGDDPRSFDEEEERKPRVAASTVIEGVSLGLSVLNTILDAIGSVDRKIAIGLDNESGQTWEHASIYFRSGTSDEVLPHKLESGYAVLFPARKTNGPTATGTVGVMCWCAQDETYTVCAMFSVPYDYNLYSNWWDVKAYSGRKNAGQDIYEDLYYGDPFKGDSSWDERDLGSGLKMRGAMSASGACTLQIHVERK